MTTLDAGSIERLLARLAEGDERDDRAAASDARGWRSPVHVVYGGAHLFRADTVQKLGARAREALDAHAPDAETFRAAVGLDLEVEDAASILDRVREKLAREPVEDFRIDFEDGFGPRSDAEEDAAATAAARAIAEAQSRGTLPPFCGFRVKSLAPATRARALRTLDLFLGTLCAATSELPHGFVVTLPKVSRAAEVEVLVDALHLLEAKLGVGAGTLRVELMVETTSALVSTDGRLALPGLVAAAGGRCTALHFGAYDYASSLGIAASDQSLSHPACVLARQLLLLAGTQTGVAVSDGATNVLPVPVHRGTTLDDAQRADNTRGIHAAWRLHFRQVRQAFREGFACGWDLHPAQLVARYAAVYAHFASSFAGDAARLRGFVEAAGQATLKGTVFDDAASALGLLNAVSSALACGAVGMDEVEEATGLTMAEIRGRSFAGIVAGRR